MGYINIGGGDSRARINTDTKMIELNQPNEPMQVIGGIPDGPDFVVEYSTPGTNPWYRKYKSGWVEQGGTTTVVPYNHDMVISLPIVMKNSDYYVEWQHLSSGHGWVARTINKTINDFTMAKDSFVASSGNSLRQWRVCGYSENAV
jgi:hypothetical protein